jgi:SAM-dependent methyltransferase
VLVTSRSFEEYAAFFALDVDTLHGRRVLDCSAGASSFVARARTAGVDAVAADPVYAMPGDELASVAAASTRDGASIAVQHADRFTWEWYGTAAARDRMRARALAEFLLDLATHPDRYVPASLPALAFDDDAFDLALCSHLLFTWADQLGLDWHAAALRELARVAPEVRVFPTVMQGAGAAVPFWDELMDRLRADGLLPELRRVPYEFQVGADMMLVVTRP